MRLLLASLIFLVAGVDMTVGSGTGPLDLAALAAALLLCLSVIIDVVWLDPAARRRREPRTPPEGQ